MNRVTPGEPVIPWKHTSATPHAMAVDVHVIDAAYLPRLLPV